MNTVASPDTWPRWATRAILVLAALYGMCHIVVTLGWVLSPGVNEYREWAQAEAALSIFAPDGPYSGGAGHGIYVYGLLYPLLGGAVHALFSGDILTELRLLSYVLSWLVALSGAWWIWHRTGAAWASALGGALLLVVDWQNVTGSATPAPLGSLLLLFAVVAVQRRRWGAAALLTVLCFYVKPYFLAIYLPLQLVAWGQSRHAALRFFFLFVLCGIGSVIAVHAVFPYYFVYNVVHHVAAASSSWPHLMRQCALCVLLYAPLFAVLLMSVVRERRLWRKDALLLSTLLLWLVWLRLGLHTGAFMSYALHLCLPPLVIFALPRLSSVIGALWLALVTLFLGSIYILLPLPPAGTHTSGAALLTDAEWRQAKPVINLSPAYARMAHEQDVPTLDNGQGQYISTLYSEHALWQAMFPEMRDLRERATTFEPRLRSQLEANRWRTVVSDSRSILSPEEFRAMGYQAVKRHGARVGVHDIEIYIWQKNELQTGNDKAL